MPALITWWSQDIQPLAPDAPRQAVVDAGARLLARWTALGRQYHSTRHLVELFWALEELEEAGTLDPEQSRVARVAAWFHDAVYDARGADGTGERESAGLAREVLTALGVDRGVVDEVERLVLLTLGHRAEADDPLGAAFCDADLWILSAPAERYDEYTEQVRAEYAHVPEAAFRAGRRSVLEHLTGAEVYATAHARHTWTGRARENVTRELSSLS